MGILPPMGLGACNSFSTPIDGKVLQPCFRNAGSRRFLVPMARTRVDQEHLTVEPLNEEYSLLPERYTLQDDIQSKQFREEFFETVSSSAPLNESTQKRTRARERRPWHAVLQGKVESMSNEMKGALATSTTEIKNWARDFGRSNSAPKILETDKRLITEWTMETAIPAITKALLLMSFENPSAVLPEPPIWQAPSYPGLSGWDLMAADIATIRQFFDNVKLQFAIWTVPLQSNYDSEELAAYFNARPQVLLFRALEVSAAFSYLFVWYMFERGITSLKSRREPSESENLQLAMKTAEMFKQTVLKLGPTFTKVAQSLSTRSDLVGPDTAKVLADLQDRLPPFSNEDAMLVIEQELGCPRREVFSYLSPEPVAAASLGQVYKGKTLDGQEVAVKVQRPNIFYSIARDVYILRLGLGLVRKIARINSDLSVFADEIGRGLYGELDYRLEAQNAAAFETALAPKLPFVVVPKVLPHLTTRKVMTMEWIAGTRPTDLRRVAKGQDLNSTPEQQEEARSRLLEMVNKGVQSSLTQLLDAGILHADPHPGNIIYTPDNSIAYLDFGLICRLERKHQYAMIAATTHLVNGDWNYLVDDLAEMDVVKPTTNRFRLQLALGDALSGLVVKNGLPDFKFSQIIAKLFTVALKFRFRLPAYYTLILRSIASLEGMALAVDPNFKVFTKTYPFVIRRLLSDNSSAMRRILRTVLLTSKKELRWDRVASFMTIPSLGPGMSKETQTTEETIETTLYRLILSSNGAALRRIVLEADTRSLALAFVSKEAAPARLKIAKILTDAFYRHGRRLLQRYANINLQAPSTIDVSSNSRHLQFVLGVLFRRLQAMPLLMLRVGLTATTVVSWAIAVSLHRLAVALSFRYVDTAATSA